MLSRLGISALLGLVVVGCGGGRPANYPTNAPGMNERRFANLKATAARDLSCAEEQLTHEFVTDPQVKNGLHKLSGCGQRTEYELMCMMGNCVWIQTPLRQAAFELNCPQESLQVMRLSASQLGVQGCDKRATYVRTCAPGTGCTWLLSTAAAGETQEAPPASGSTSL
jgi:hypothetical protein